MDVSGTLDGCEACLCSSLDPPVLFSYTLHAFCICLSLSCLGLCEPSASVDPIGSLKRFFTLHCVKTLPADSCLCETRASVLCQPAALCQKTCRCKKDSVNEWKNMVGKVLYVSHAKERLSEMKQEQVKYQAGFFRIIGEPLWVYIILLDVCWSWLKIFRNA